VNRDIYTHTYIYACVCECIQNREPTFIEVRAHQSFRVKQPTHAFHKEREREREKQATHGMAVRTMARATVIVKEEEGEEDHIVGL